MNDLFDGDFDFGGKGLNLSYGWAVRKGMSYSILKGPEDSDTDEYPYDPDELGDWDDGEYE